MPFSGARLRMITASDPGFYGSVTPHYLIPCGIQSDDRDVREDSAPRKVSWDVRYKGMWKPRKVNIKSTSVHRPSTSRNPLQSEFRGN